MNICIRTGFANVHHNIIFQPATKEKGKQLALSGHLQEVQELRNNGASYLIESKVIRQTAVNATPYSTILHIDPSRFITLAECTCVYNQSNKCKHIASLIYYINNEQSLTKTSHEQEWGKPTAKQFAAEKYSKGRCFEQMFPPKGLLEVNPIPVLLSDLKKDSPLKLVLLEYVRDENNHAATAVIKTLLDQVDDILQQEDCQKCVLDLLMRSKQFPLYQKSYVLNVTLQDFYEKIIVINDEKAVNLSCATITQSNSNEWYETRKLRISASVKVHKIKIRKKKNMECLISEMLGPKKIETPALKYGIQHELHAKQAYEKLTGYTVQHVGVIVSTRQPWLCASLDGVVMKDGCAIKIVEFKCPYTCRNEPIIDITSKKINVPYLQLIEDKIYLKESHLYYTQVQVQMYVSGTSTCDFFIFSAIENGCCLVRVTRSEDFLKKVILASELFYFQHYLQKLYEKRYQDNICDIIKNNKTKFENNLIRSFTGQNVSNII